MEPVQQAIVETGWLQALWALILTPLTVPKVREFLAEWLWKKWFGKKDKPKKDFFERREADQLEARLTATLQANHEHTIKELKEHDERVRIFNKENREWLEHRLDTQEEKAERRSDAQFQKLDNFITIVTMAQRDR